jgi:pyruvate/2-oxoglutarate dehydrogenase complex dihydrolipoamide dehydrogenase (E3) component
MPETLTPDICVIGGGSGGLSVAAAAAAFGVPVVLVEKGKMGGDCLNTGCVPSKALLAAAKHAQGFRANGFGIAPARPEIDFSKVHDHVHGVIAAIAPVDSKERFTGLGVRVIEGAARFTDAQTVAAGEDIIVKARRFVIATGSSPAVPPIPGLDRTPHLTNESIFDLTERPEHLIVIGGGPIGLEMAQAFRRLGTKVTVIEALRPLAKDDPECAAVVLAQLEHEGIDIRSGAKVVRVEQTGDAVQVVVAAGDGEETVQGSHLLVATGRKPTTEGLGLDAAGIKHERTGIVVDKGLRTTNKKVYAIGDVAGRAQFTHVANYHAGLVIRNALFRLPVKADDGIIPWVTYTDPELAHVGLTEDQARERHRRIRILRWPFRDNDRAEAERTPYGHIKVVTSKGGRILGATIVGTHAGELIATWSLAISQGLNIRAFTGMIVPYPTRAEISKRAAITYFTPSLTSPWVRRTIEWLRRLG